MRMNPDDAVTAGRKEEAVQLSIVQRQGAS
jgi:ubiquitin